MLKHYLRTILSLPCQLYLKIKSTSKGHIIAEEKVIVSMTSWTKRIGNVKAVIDSIYANTTKPDKVVLNLSLEEFPNKMEDLPVEIVELSNNNLLEIIWNEGNSKAFKKFIPTMKRYPNDIIIAIDDDFIYPTDFIATFVTAHEKAPRNPLTGNYYKFYGVQTHCGCASLVKSEYYGPYIYELLDEKVIEYRFDDIFYTICATLNGVRYKSVGKTFFYNMDPNNPIEGISTSVDYTFDDLKDYLVDKIKRKYHINLSVLSKPIFWV